MNKKIIYFSTLIFLSILVNACYYDKFDAVHPLDGYKNPCDPSADSTYTQSIRYIMAYNCTSCHNQTFAQGNVKLDTYGSVVEQAQNGKLMGTILHQSGYKAMPIGGQIPACQIEKVQQWVDAKTPL